MASVHPIITRRDDRLTIRLPARPQHGWTWLLGIPFAAPFILFGLLWTSPQLFGGKVTINAPAGFEWVAKGIAAAFGGAFILLGGSVAAKSLISRFGRTEIILTRGRVRVMERVGFLFVTSYRSLATLTRLDVVKPPVDANIDGEPLTMLEAYFSDSKPLLLAKMYPAEALKPVAKELIGAIAGFRGPRNIPLAGPPPITRIHATPTITQPKDKLILLSKSKNTTTVTLLPCKWPVLVWPLVILSLATTLMVVAGTGLGQSSRGWAMGLHGVERLLWALPLFPLMAGVGVTLWMRTRYVYEVSREGLVLRSHSPVRTSARHWSAAQIDQIFIETRTVPSKGGPTTIRSLILLLKTANDGISPIVPTRCVISTGSARLSTSRSSAATPRNRLANLSLRTVASEVQECRALSFGR